MKKLPFLFILLICLAQSQLLAEKLYYWGTDYFGENIIYFKYPTIISQENNWSAIACEATHYLLINEDGSLWVCGQNNSGQLGTGESWTKFYQTPAKNQLLLNPDRISVGKYHSAVLGKNKMISTCGDNHFGQLGNGTSLDNFFFIVINDETDWQIVSLSSDHCLALKTDGSLWGWGNNIYGQAGDKAPNNIFSPRRIGTDNDWKKVSCGMNNSFAIKNDGSLWAWGCNNRGQLGDGTYEHRAKPVKIESETAWIDVSGGVNHSIGIKFDGTLWSWGNNSNGQLGYNSNNDQTIPRQIGTDRDWSYVECNHYHSFAIKNDGTLWAWGKNDRSQLGDSTNEDKFSPVRIGKGIKWKSIATSEFYTIALGEEVNSVEINESENLHQINIFPNPASNHLILKRKNFTESAKIEIYNMLGAIVYIGNFNSGISDFTIDLTLFTPSVYNIVVICGNGQVHKGIFIKE